MAGDLDERCDRALVVDPLQLLDRPTLNVAVAVVVRDVLQHRKGDAGSGRFGERLDGPAAHVGVRMAAGEIDDSAHSGAVPDRSQGLDRLVLHVRVTVVPGDGRSEEHTSELQSRNDISYAVFC